jgi:NADH-quinone oxidoreductase subunit N
MWTPDVYQGAPTPVTAFMSVGTKAAAFAAFYRLFLMGLPDQQAVWGPALAILAVLTMTLGNLAALRQTSLKRMLAYSSIAHAGYILVGLAPGTGFGVTASLFYLISYAFMNIGAFAVVAMLERQDRMDATYNRLKGMGGTRPWLAFVMAVFMLSLAGVPPLAGFFGKFFVFSAAVQGGYSWLAAIAMLNSAIGAYYYLRVVVTMYFEKPTADTVEATAEAAVPRNVPMALGLTLAVVFTVVLGVFPALWTSLFLPAVTQLTLR